MANREEQPTWGYYTLKHPFAKILRTFHLSGNRLQRVPPVKKSDKYMVIFPLVIISLGLWQGLASGTTQTVELPVTFDFQFIRSMIIYQVFTEAGERAVITEEEGCTRIQLWDPEVSSEGNFLKIRSKFSLQFGIGIGGRCVNPLDYTGFVAVLQRLQFEKESWQVTFETVDSQIYDQEGKRPLLAGFVWDRVKPYLHAHMNQIRIDLSRPIKELRDVLPLFFSVDEREEVVRWIETMRSGDLMIGSAAVKLGVFMDVSGPPTDHAKDERALPSVDMVRLIRNWQSWDAFFIYQIEALVGRTIDEEEKKILLDTLLEIRYSFSGSSDKDLGNDFIARQFTWAWERVSGILRKHLFHDPSPSLINYLAFFTASDALTVLERLGPVVTIDISLEGLLKVARLLSQSGEAPSLDYDYGIDPQLRSLLGLGPPLDESGPAFDDHELDMPGTLPFEETQPENEPSSWLRLLVPEAFAAGEARMRLTEIQKWIPPKEKEDLPRYLDGIEEILKSTLSDVLSRSSVKTKYRSMFHRLIKATAWQETCWRQFVIKNDKVTYVLSYNQSSVGLMQINERVWRGIYRPESLRWNIRYNAMAGAEILDLYFHKYVLTENALKDVPEADSLAVILYAMYNGGPGELRRFIGRDRGQAMNSIDTLFEEKYGLVRRGELQKISICLFGNGSR
jgi:hypothetical protein